MKKYILLFMCIMAVHLTVGQQNVGVGTTTPAASAKLEVASTTQGMLVPRMTTAQRIAISSPATGLLVFDMTTNSFWFRGSSSWNQLVDSVHTEVHRNGINKIYTGLTDNVGIGMISPANKLDINLGAPRTGTHPTNLPLYVTGDQIGPDVNGVEIRQSNGTEGIGIGTSTIYAAGSNPTQGLSFNAGYSGNLRFLTGGGVPMLINSDGNVSIGNTQSLNKLDINSGYVRTGAHGSGRPLYVTGDMGPNSNGIEFRHNSGVQGIGFGYNTIYAAGSDADQNLGIQAKGATGNLLFSTDENERMRVTGDGRVGIGVTNPQAMLEIIRGTNSIAPGGTLQIDGTTRNSHFNYGPLEHTYIRGGKEGANVILNDLGLGNVGIGTSAPQQKLHVAGNATVNGYLGIGQTEPQVPLQFANDYRNRKIVLFDPEDINSDDLFFGFGVNEGLLRYQAQGDHAFFAGGLESSYELMRITSGGNVGIGTSDPHAPLQFNNNLMNRKIVLYEGANNDHAYYGFGVQGSILRYQVSNPGDNHVFYAATISGTSSNELMRIMGNGKVGIGVANPGAMLEIARGTAFNAPNGSLQINGTTYASHFNYGTSEDTYIRGGKAGGKVIINEYGDQGNVGIGTNNPSEKLAVNGNVTVSGSLKIGYARVTGANVDVPPGNYGTATCNCPSGLVAIGGGFIESTNNIQILKSYANTDSSWSVYVFNDDAFFHTVQAFVVCARLAN